MKFFEEIGELECLAGDTLPTFVIGVEMDADAHDLSKCRMQMILADLETPDVSVLTKNCTACSSESYFEVTLTSEDTKVLSGTFLLHFRLVDEKGMSHRNLMGVLTVKPCPQEDET